MRRAALSKRPSAGQQGNVLLMVMLLIIMFSGMGLLAMRNTVGEMRSALSYYDATEAAVVAEGAVALLATDMTLNYDAPAASGSTNYMDAYAANRNTALPEFQLSFSPYFDTAGAYTAGQLPDPFLNGRFTSAPLGLTPALGSGMAAVTLTHRPKYPAPPPPGYSNDDASMSNMEFYYFEVIANASFGPSTTASSVIAGQATARTRMMIGPLPKR